MAQLIRVMPVLLLKDWGIVKTVRFGKETYIGCPINAVRVFTAKNVDELILLDIRASAQGRGPLEEVVQQIADESCMPIAVGGGIRELAQIRDLLKCGADKVVINSEACTNPDFVRTAAARFGSQCIVISIDVRRRWNGRYEVYAQRGSRRTRLEPREYALQLEQLGAGEVLLNSVDRDGTWAGYDLPLIETISRALTIPVIACGGAGKLQDFADAVNVGHASAVSAGSLFLFHGRRRGILINFPTREELQSVLGADRVRT